MRDINILGITLIGWMLLSMFFAFESYQKDEFIRNQQIENDSLKQEIKYLKQKIEYFKFENFPVNMIVIGKKSLHCVSSLGGKGFDPWTKYHIKELKDGINEHDFALNDSTRVEIKIEKN